MATVLIIGAGFSGLSAACHLAKAGMQVTVLEKHDTPGGRARSFSSAGFSFDMGPSWYWMPDVFEKFFAGFGKKVSDYYELLRLDPSYQVFWEDERASIPAGMAELTALFERYEEGAGRKLERFLAQAGEKYRIAMAELIYSPGLSIKEFARADVLKSFFKMDLLKSFATHARQFFKHPKLLQLVEFPILFLGALPKNTPALYSLMNWADMKLGTWYPMGGMKEIALAMESLAKSLGVQFRYNENAEGIIVEDNRSVAVRTATSLHPADIIIGAADYHFVESILPEPYRNYTENYWERRSMAPSCLIYYIGINKLIPSLQHHNLFFDAPFEEHAAALYTKPDWPKNPLMYVCCPSKTDESVAPQGCENLFALIPVAPGLTDTESIRAKYFEKVITRLETRTGIALHDNIVYRRSYAAGNFIEDYNAYKGNAYGLANTLRQTAILKPSIRNKKLKNLFYTGQLTVPGPGVPPAIISGEIVAAEVLKNFSQQKMQTQ